MGPKRRTFVERRTFSGIPNWSLIEMFLTAGVVLVVLWLFGFLVFKKVVGGLIHILLIIAIIALVLHFMGRG